MKTKLENGCDGPCVRISYEILNALGLKIGDALEIDIPMVGGDIVIHKASQRTGEEVV